MEAVTNDAFVRQLARQRKESRKSWSGSMKAGIETGDLRHARRHLGDSVNCCEVMWLVQRRERYKTFQFFADHLIDDHWPGEFTAAMNNAVSRRYRCERDIAALQSFQKLCDQPFMGCIRWNVLERLSHGGRFALHGGG